MKSIFHHHSRRFTLWVGDIFLITVWQYSIYSIKEMFVHCAFMTGHWWTYSTQSCNPCFVSAGRLLSDDHWHCAHWLPLAQTQRDCACNSAYNVTWLEISLRMIIESHEAIMATQLQWNHFQAAKKWGGRWGWSRHIHLPLHTHANKIIISLETDLCIQCESITRNLHWCKPTSSALLCRYMHNNITLFTNY